MMLPIHLYKLRAGTKYWYHNTVFRFFVSKKFAKNIFKNRCFDGLLCATGFIYTFFSD